MTNQSFVAGHDDTTLLIIVIIILSLAAVTLLVLCSVLCIKCLKKGSQQRNNNKQDEPETMFENEPKDKEPEFSQAITDGDVRENKPEAESETQSQQDEPSLPPHTDSPFFSHMNENFGSEANILHS